MKWAERQWRLAFCSASSLPWTRDSKSKLFGLFFLVFCKKGCARTQNFMDMLLKRCSSKNGADYYQMIRNSSTTKRLEFEFGLSKDFSHNFLSICLRAGTWRQTKRRSLPHKEATCRICCCWKQRMGISFVCAARFCPRPRTIGWWVECAITDDSRCYWRSCSVLQAVPLVYWKSSDIWKSTWQELWVFIWISDSKHE